MLFLSSFNATMHINCLLPSHKLTTFIIIIACYSNVSHMFDAISLFCSLSSKCIFLFQLLPNVMFLLVISITFLVIPAWDGAGGEQGCFHFCSLLFASLFTWSRKSRSDKHILSQRFEHTGKLHFHLSNTRFLPLPLQLLIQVITL